MDIARIAILSAQDKVQAFMDNDAPDALHYYDDELHEYLEGSAYTYSFKASAKHEDSRHLAEGGKISFRYREKDYYLNIMKVIRTEYVVEVTAYGLVFELLNEDAPEYKADKAMSFGEYLAVFDSEKTVELGINEVSDRKIANEWTGTSTILARIYSMANVFGAEAEFVPELNKDYSLKRLLLNVYREHDVEYQGIGERRKDIALRYGVDVKGITKTSDITELYTAIYATGKDGLTVASLNKQELDADGNIEFSSPAGDGCIRAVQARDRFPSNLLGNNASDRYILKRWSYDTDNVNTLYGQSLAELKKLCEPNVKYEVDGYFDTDIGDTVNIADEEYNPPLYLEARVTEQVRSFTNPKLNKTTFDNFTELSSEISEDLLKKMEALIAENKAYTCMISTDNGIVFKNSEGSTILTANVRDAGADVTDEFTIQWQKDGIGLAEGRTIIVNASDVDAKAVYRFEAIDADGKVRGSYEVTVTDVTDGKPSYIHIAYANSEDGTVDFSISDTDRRYVGLYADLDLTASTDPSKYQWSLFRGADGKDGADGQDGADGADGTPGKPGEDGRTPYIHFAYANSADGAADFSVSDSSNRQYLGTYADFVQADSTDPAKYSWMKTKGADGKDGVPGPAGKDGKTSYFHVKYSAVANPSTSSQMSETPDAYIGTYVDYTEEDSADPAKYTWARFQGLQGKDGENGIPGVDGTNGKTSYLHIKYSDDGGKTFTANNGEKPGDYIGQYVDFAQADSSSVSAYTWSKIRGEDGEKGEQGTQGINILRNTRDYRDWVYTTYVGAVAFEGENATITASGKTSNAYYNIRNWIGSGYYEDIKGKTVTISFEIKSDDWNAVNEGEGVNAGLAGVGIQIMRSKSNPFGGTLKQSDYRLIRLNNSTYIREASTVNGAWTRVVTRPLTITDDFFNYKVDEEQPYVAFMFQLRRNGTVSFRHAKIEYGDVDDPVWTPAVEDLQGVGIADVANKYAVSSSNTATPTAWSDTVPTMTTTNKYLWNYEVITYTDGTTSETEKRVIGVYGNTGSTGAAGKDGADGVGISSIAEYYLASASAAGVTTATAGWTTAVQATTTSKKYLWNYEVITFTDGTSHTSAPVIIGTHGATGATGAAGKDGRGVSSTAVTYQASASGTAVPAGTWSSSIPSVAAGSYLWTRTVITYTDGTTSTLYSVGKMGSTGATGATGPAGKGISSITEYYLASASSSGVTASTSGWTTSIQTITTSKKYLWNYEVIAYTDGTSTTTSPKIIGIYGNTGAMGATGATGNGIKSVTNYYLATASGSGVTKSNSGWTTSVQSITTSKKYLWNYEVITYTDGTTTTTAPAIIGVYGNTGATGAAGKDGADGERGTGILKITTAPTTYTTTTNGITPMYRIALSTVTSQAGVTEVLAGDILEYSYYHYPVLMVYSSYVYCGARTSIRGATGATGVAGKDGADGTDGEDGKMLYATCGTAAATAAKVATITPAVIGFTLYTGVVVSVKFTVTNTAASPTLNVNSSGAKVVYYRGAAISAGYLAANRTYMFCYNGTQWEFIGDVNTDSNTYDRTRFQGAVKASTAIVAGNIIVGNSSGYHHLKAGGVFDISYPILYAGSAIASASTGTNNYLVIPFTVTTTQGIALTAYKAVYIKGTLSGTIFTPASTAPLTQTIPTTADGYYYLYLGLAYSATGMYLMAEHPLYRYVAGAFRESSSIFYDLFADNITAKGTITGAKLVGAEAYLSNGLYLKYAESDQAEHDSEYGMAACFGFVHDATALLLGYSGLMTIGLKCAGDVEVEADDIILRSDDGTEYSFLNLYRRVPIFITGTTVVTGTGANYAKLWTTSQMQSMLAARGAKYDSGFMYHLTVIANNGDGNANGVHVTSVDYYGESYLAWYAYFSGSMSGSYRINYTIIYDQSYLG